MTINCLKCNVEFYTKPARIKVGKGKYCSKKCHYTRNGEKIEKVCQCGNKFVVPPSLIRIESCSLSCKAKLLYNREKFTMKGKTAWNRGKPTSIETRLKQRQAKLGIRGKNHWNYKDGSINRNERHYLMQHDEYKQWRWSVFKRDKFTCRSCFKKG